ILIIWRVALQWLANAFPAIASAGEVTVSPAVYMAAPALLAIGQAIVRAIEVSAVVALFVEGVRGVPRADKYADVVALVALFFLIVDPSARGSAIVVMLLSSASAAVLAWALVRYVLR